MNIDEIISEFIDIKPKEETKQKPYWRLSFFERKKKKADDLTARIEASRNVQQLMNSPAWKSIIEPKLRKSLTVGFGTLIRDGLNKSEAELKAIISDMRANLSLISSLKFTIEDGERSKNELSEELKKEK